MSGVGNELRPWFAFLAVSVVVVAIGAADVCGQERELADRSDLFPPRSFFFLDLGGSFRTRAELWQDVDMGLAPIPNKYGVYPVVSQEAGGFRETTDLRFRLAPTLNAGEASKVKAVLDVLSVQAGENGDSDIAQALSSAFAATPPGASTSPVDSMYVQALWAEMRLFHILTLQAGRIPAMWGMGILENDGSGIDADGGDVVDGLAAVGDLGATLRASLSMDLPLEGRVVEDAAAPWGEAYDSGDEDDIIQLRLKLWSEPVDERDHFSWGVYSRFRWHDFSSLNSKSPFPECAQYPWAPASSCNELFWREAFIWTPDAFVEGAFEVGESALFSFQAEIAGRYGTLGATRIVTPEPSDRTVYGVGGALHSALAWPSLEIRLDVGGASGDSETLAFGLLDRPILGEPDSTRGGGSSLAIPGDSLTAFALNSNHLIDLILFRHVVGAVTNAFYARPGLNMDLWSSGDSALSFDASAMYAYAFAASATPGESNQLGVEGDLGLRLDAGQHVSAMLDYGMLFPLEGLSGASTLSNPMPWTARVLLNIEF